MSSDLLTAYIFTGGEPLPAQKRIVGGACVAQYSSDGAYYRARILELGNGSAEVFFVDYGNKEKVDFSSLSRFGF